MADQIQSPTRSVATKLSAEDAARSKVISDQVNKTLKARGKNTGEPLGKDSFLKLLVTELRHQDPTQPMADKEFIAQMAQFSSLEQMNNISSSMKSLNKKARMSEAYELIGKKIEAFSSVTNLKTEGVVSHVTRSGDDVNLMVNGNEVPLDDVHAVYPAPVQEQARQRETVQKRTSIYDNAIADTVNRGQAARSYESSDVQAQNKSVDKIQ